MARPFDIEPLDATFGAVVRGVKVAADRGTCERGFTCPFHGWCYAPDGKNTAVTRRKSFAEHNLAPVDLDLTPVRCEVWGGCAWITPPTCGPWRAS